MLPEDKRKPYYIYGCGIQNHVLSDRPKSKRVAAGQGWLRINEIAVLANSKEWKVGRRDRDPEKEVTIPPRAVVKFRPGKEMKEKVAKLLPSLRKGRKK